MHAFSHCIEGYECGTNAQASRADLRFGEGGVAGETTIV